MLAAAIGVDARQQQRRPFGHFGMAPQRVQQFSAASAGHAVAKGKMMTAQIGGKAGVAQGGRLFGCQSGADIGNLSRQRPGTGRR